MHSDHSTPTLPLSEKNDKTHLHEDGVFRLPCFWNEAHNELRVSRITRTLKSNDLPKYQISEHERRGDMGKARVWRIAFFRRSVAELLLLALNSKGDLTSRHFWEVQFPQWWFGEGNHRNLPPPLLPSIRRPPESIYAASSEYREFANSALRARIDTHFPYLRPYVPKSRYQAEDPTSFEAHAWLLSAVSVILTAQRLDLLALSNRKVEDILGPRWLDPTEADPFNFRFRNKIWPDLRYNYVDVRLRPILAQALQYRDDGWGDPWQERSLPLTEAATRSHGFQIEHTGLRRSDIELAVWCEAMSRMLEAGAFIPMQGDASCCDDKAMNTPFSGLPSRLRNVAEALWTASQQAASRTTTGTRFSAFETPAASSALIDALSASRWRLGANTNQLPTSIATPVLEDDRLSVNLDWDLIAPDAEWMSVHVVALTAYDNRLQCNLVDFEELLSEPSGNPLFHANLYGATWQRLRQTHSAATLEASFLDALIACQLQAEGNGCLVLILLDLSKSG